MKDPMFKTEISSVDLKKELKQDVVTVNHQFVSGFHLLFIRLGMRIRLLGLIIRSYSAPNDWIHALKHLITLRKNILGVPSIKKIVRVNGRFYMGIYTPSWFSKEFDEFICAQLNDFKPLKTPVKRFDIIFVSVTNKCPFLCEHCYHWHLLNKKDNQSEIELSNIIEKLQQRGVGHIQFSGGEPLLESEKICRVVKSSNPASEFWITTSGFSLSYDKAIELKSSGIRGIIISLDHYDPEKHNKFRNHKDAFKWVEVSVRNAISAELLVALSICITKEFLTKVNLENYMLHAKNMGVMFVQFLEPKPVGHFENKNVLLTKNQINELEEFFLKYNFTSKYLDYPIIVYPGYHQRRIGCMFSGKKSIYIDTSGNVNPCPFCHKSYGKVLEDDFNSRLEKLAEIGCADY